MTLLEDRAAEAAELFEGIEREILIADTLNVPIRPALLKYYLILKSRQPAPQRRKSSRQR